MPFITSLAHATILPLRILVAHSCTSEDMAAACVLAAVAPRPPLLPVPPPPASCCCANGKAACWSRSRNIISQQHQHGGTCNLSAAARINNLLLSTRGTQRSSSSSRRVPTVASSFVRGKPEKRQVVVPEPDYRIPLVLLGFAGAFGYQDNLLVAAPIGLLGLLLLFQTTRVRFVFDDEALEVKVGDQLNNSGENVFVGGKNCWKYSTFMNWEFWWPSFPVLVYFKEAQTRPEGQVHFFPVIFNGKQLYNVMVERAGPSKTSGPKDS